jgi:hypothetical protein
MKARCSFAGLFDLWGDKKAYVWLNWRKISIARFDLQTGETKAQSCVKAC